MKECEELNLSQVCRKNKKILKCEIEKCKSNLNSLIDVNRYANEFEQLNDNQNADFTIKKDNILLP